MRAAPILRRFLMFSKASWASRILISSELTTVLRARIDVRNVGD